MEKDGRNVTEIAYSIQTVSIDFQSLESWVYNSITDFFELKGFKET